MNTHTPTFTCRQDILKYYNPPNMSLINSHPALQKGSPYTNSLLMFEIVILAVMQVNPRRLALLSTILASNMLGETKKEYIEKFHITKKPKKSKKS